jgi:putative acetyltransferase
MNDLTVRHSASGDGEQLRQIFAEPSNYSATLQLPFPSLELWEKRLAGHTEGRFSLVACRGEELVGQLGVFMNPNPRRRHVAALGMAVKSTARRQGVGSALLNAAIELTERWQAVRRIELEVFTDNEPAIALYRKFGFETEGTLRQFAFRDGKYADVYLMARVSAP